MHIQKDKQAVLHPHYEKCVFICYPDGYKGWKFYNPTTKHTIISERADFNKHPANSIVADKSAAVANTPNVTYLPPDLSGNVDDDKAVVASKMLPPQVELLGKDNDKPAPPAPAPAPPVTPPSRASSPIGIGARLPVRN